MANLFAKEARICHSPVFAAQGIAALANIPGKELAKTVMVKRDGKLDRTVLHRRLPRGFGAVQAQDRGKTAEIAVEEEFRDFFPECETGAGNLYGIELLAEVSLTKHGEITFKACTHRELIRLQWEDFHAPARATVMRFAAGSSAEAA